MLLEKATGIYTGSVYRDKQLLEGGFLGEETEPEDGETLFQKSHEIKEDKIANAQGQSCQFLIISELGLNCLQMSSG